MLPGAACAATSCGRPCRKKNMSHTAQGSQSQDNRDGKKASPALGPALSLPQRRFPAPRPLLPQPVRLIRPALFLIENRLETRAIIRVGEPRESAAVAQNPTLPECPRRERRDIERHHPRRQNANGSVRRAVRPRPDAGGARRLGNTHFRVDASDLPVPPLPNELVVDLGGVWIPPHQPGHGVAELERAPFIPRIVVPRDSIPRLSRCHRVGPRLLALRPRVEDIPLPHSDLDQLFARLERDIPVGVRELALEPVGDDLRHPHRPVGSDSRIDTDRLDRVAFFRARRGMDHRERRENQEDDCSFHASFYPRHRDSFGPCRAARVRPQVFPSDPGDRRPGPSGRQPAFPLSLAARIAYSCAAGPEDASGPT